MGGLWRACGITLCFLASVQAHSVDLLELEHASAVVLVLRHRVCRVVDEEALVLAVDKWQAEIHPC